jgi:hypothetical protein
MTVTIMEAFTFSIRKQILSGGCSCFAVPKYLYATNIYSEYETWDIRSNREDILNFFRQYGIRFVILSFTAETHIPSVQTLRALVQDEDKFSLLKKFPVINDDYGNGDISIYLFKESESMAGPSELEIPMPTLGKTVKILMQDAPAGR